MSKNIAYRISIVLFSLSAAFGGWFFMNKMLEQKEDKILGQTGQITVDLAGRETTNTEGSVSSFDGQKLSENERIKVLKVWETGKKLVPHEPLKGQMNMEQAIARGKEWIAIIEKSEKLFPVDAVREFENTGAKLCSFEDGAEVGKEKISFWEIQYKNKKLQILLKIHALSGEIWEAEITTEENDRGSSGPDGELLKTAFPFFAAVSDNIYGKNRIRYMQNKTESLYLLMKQSDVRVNSQPGMRVYKLWVGTGVFS